MAVERENLVCAVRDALLDLDSRHSNRALSEALGVATSTVSDWRNGKSLPDTTREYDGLTILARLERLPGEHDVRRVLLPVLRRVHEYAKVRMGPPRRGPDFAIGVNEAELDDPIDEVVDYLRALHEALGRTPSWHRHAVVDAGFLERKVTMITHPARDLHQITTPTQMYSAPNRIVEGRVAWREAITPTRIAVVLADAGYGKSWLLKLYGRILCQEALDRLGRGELLADVPLPIWLHAADLASRWTTGGGPIASVLDAAGTVTAEKGYVPSSALRKVLAARLARSGPDLHVLVDAYDEVFDDNDHQAAGKALRWLASLTTAQSGPRIVLSSRPSGYQCPFSTAGPVPGTPQPADPRYLLLGALSEDQVTELWQGWYSAAPLPYPAERLDPVLRPDSRMRDFARVPLVAAFCAVVAETTAVHPTRAGLYDQVLATFLSLAWKEDDRSPRGTGPARDPVQQVAWNRALEDLAWGMATDPRGWCDAIEAAACEDQLAARGPAASGRESRTSRLVREHGILVMLGGTMAGVTAKVLWIHRSVHEFLTARRLVGLPAAEGRAMVELLATSPQWIGVRDFAMELRSE
ncbi:NACHT domain-containing protein [Micromonospora tulbaghiae]|uniref:NACHT domain-containing protein n=1 Tax=Micromonospora tulbaghiae TaxID=479978 RepID=UPI003424CC7B